MASKTADKSAKHAKKTYPDGHPLDAVHYREHKILLEADHQP